MSYRVTNRTLKVEHDRSEIKESDAGPHPHHGIQAAGKNRQYKLDRFLGRFLTCIGSYLIDSQKWLICAVCEPYSNAASAEGCPCCQQALWTNALSLAHRRRCFATNYQTDSLRVSGSDRRSASICHLDRTAVCYAGPTLRYMLTEVV